MPHVFALLAAASPSYSTEKALAAIPTVALVLIAFGFVFPLGARARANRLTKKIATGSAAGAAGQGSRDQPTPQETKLKSRRARAVQQQGQSYFSVLLGVDGRLSTSKTIAALWTVVVIYILFALIFVWPADWPAALRHLTPTYALLLAGPYASLVLAKAAVSLRASSGSLQKPQSDGVVRLSDLVGDDSGQPSLFDVQYVSFNVIAIVFVIDAFTRATLGGFPAIPSGLALLTGGPAAVYLANKTLGSNAAVIFSVQPSVVRAKETFTIFGQNFAPNAPKPSAGQSAGQDQVQAPTVEVDGVTAEVANWTDTAIAATVSDLPQGGGRPVGVSVVTSAGQRALLSNALTLVTKPSLLGLDKAQAAVGDHVTATGRWSTADGLVPIVLLDELTAATIGQPIPGTNVTFIVPQVNAALPATTAIKIVVAGEQSDEPISLNVAWAVA